MSPLALAALALGLALWHAAGAAQVRVDGLIVKLRDSPRHEQLQGAAEPQRRRATLESQRWQRLIEQSALAGSSGKLAPRLRPVGRDQQRLRFERRLSRDEATQLAQRLRRHPDVAWVEADTREQLLQVPDDPHFAAQWWLHSAGGTNQNALADRRRGVPGFLRAWQSGIPGSLGAPAAVVAVLDSGITAHPELAGRTLPGYDFVAESVYANDGDGRDADASDPGDWVSQADLADPAFDGCDRRDSSWHGTLIAGLVAAAGDNGQGVAGIQRQGRILPLRVAGKCGAALSDIVDAMRWAAGLPVPGVPMNPHPARIVNISFGGTTVCGPAYQEAIDELRALGVVVVAAAGNGFSPAPTRPSSCNGAVGVVALNRDGFKTTYSNFGPVLSATGIATVGGDDGDGRWGALLADGGLLSLYNDGVRVPGTAGYAGLFGTSFATPLVSGALGLMLSVNPALSWDQLIAGLRLSARPHVVSPRIGTCSEANPGRCICSPSSCGVGILDAEQALRYAAAPLSYVSPARQPEVIDNLEVQHAAALGPDRGIAPTPLPEVPSDGGAGLASPVWLLLLVLALQGLRRLHAADMRGNDSARGDALPPGATVLAQLRRRFKP